jgi:hypothetical protein
VFECIYRHCNWISPSLSHCNVFAMHTHLHIFFHSIQWLPSQHAIPLRSFFSIPIDPFQLPYNLSLFFTSIHHPTFHIPHSMSSLVAQSIAEPKFSFCPWFYMISSTMCSLLFQCEVFDFLRKFYKFHIFQVLIHWSCFWRVCFELEKSVFEMKYT